MPETTTDEMVAVAVGLDYETDSPWVYLDDVDDPENFGNTWLIRSVPVEVAERFRTAAAEINAAVKAVHEAAGYDSINGRLVAPCGSFEGEMYRIPTPNAPTGREWWEPCRNCRWDRNEHAGGKEADR